MMATARTVSWWAAVAAVVAVLLLSACATVPDSGPVTSGQISAAGGQGQAYLQLIALPPQPDWTPDQIVNGFLTASASFASNHGVARKYLTPEAQQTWNPGWQVQVVTAPLQVGPAQPIAHQAGPYGETEIDQVRATGEELASLTQSGQYVGAQEKVSRSFTFVLTKINGQWRIANPPQQLLLSQPDFQRVYVPQNLYFLADGGRTLVPDPVFVPLDATSVNLVTQLVQALLSNPQGWLAGAAHTALPGARLRRPVTINGGTATVDLGGRGAATASSALLSEMTAQLNWTLANPADGQSPVQSVQLEINGRVRQTAAWSGDQPSLRGQPRPAVPAMRAGAVLYSSGLNGAVQELTGPSSWRAVPGEAGQGQVPLRTIAVSPDGRFVAGLPASGGEVYYAALQRNAKLTHWSHASGFTSISWDVHDNLWVAGPEGVWMIRPGDQPLLVTVGLPAGYQVSQLRVALDGVRVAMIIQSAAGGSAQLRVGAIVRSSNGISIGQTGQLEPIGTGIANPLRLTWYDADNLIVLSQSSGAPELQEVPVNGGTPQQLTVEPGTVSISAAGPANQLAAGLSNGELARTPTLNGSWVVSKGGAYSPAYPG
jgi:hypothetical protein